MKVGIIGTRGIPNRYGGFEQFAAYLACHLVRCGHQVSVYSTHDHPYAEPSWNGVDILRMPNPERIMGASAQFFYDLCCILDCRKRDYDIILQLGYTSNAIWGCLLPNKACIITNMDGIEYHRSKYNCLVKKFLRVSERLAIRYSDALVADSPVIQQHLKEKHQAYATYIAYGAEVFQAQNPRVLAPLGLEPYQYFLVIARVQADNNIETILKSYSKAGAQQPLIMVGDYEKKYGRHLKSTYNSPGIRYLGSIFDQGVLDNLRAYAGLYLHGHSAGGTNPSLLEAMACRALICAHDNPFNRHILGEDARYFKDVEALEKIFRSPVIRESYEESIMNNLTKIETQYSKERIVNAYQDLFEEYLEKHT